MDPQERPSILAVFRQYYPETTISEGRGEWQKILCPLHPESRPSASLHRERNRWSCFACDIHEDSLDVIMREEGVSFSEARGIAAERHGAGGQGVPHGAGGQSGRTVPGKPGPAGGGRKVRPRVRRFPSDWA
ncbi:CHC2 zinc finger domain-containing protein [Kitasatospora sp. NPDC127116]|uniref:CHC2 zinc finger domain-containing protein n=1 Tax=Kitasatospora sp. NPDC127116 TaxID=3345367 RepID=UPI0036389BAA